MVAWTLLKLLDKFAIQALLLQNPQGMDKLPLVQFMGLLSVKMNVCNRAEDIDW